MMNVNELKIGDSFIYKTDKGNVVGFFLIEKEIANKKITWIKFGIVAFKDKAISNLDDFKKGELFTHKVLNGLNGDYNIGVQCYSFESPEFSFLDKFQYIGNFKFDRGRFTIGGGSVFTNEMFINLEMNNIETGNARFERKPLVFIMN